MKKLILIASLAFVASCSEDVPVPKPPTFLRLDLPAHKYQTFQEPSCGYRFEIPAIYKVKSVTDDQGRAGCNKDIDLGPLNGVMFFSFIEMDKPVGDYINYAINKVDEHKVKATAIEDEQIIRPKDRVYGTFFELKGDVASPFQFYLTDSTNHFVSGVVYFNKAPNYDSLRPSLEYLKTDVKQLLNSFKWK